jgi:hypothetical protein
MRKAGEEDEMVRRGEIFQEMLDDFNDMKVYKVKFQGKWDAQVAHQQ